MRKDEKIVFFTGAGMSAESGIHTYRGEGGIWDSYKWRDVACQEAFETDPIGVLDFHEKRRMEALEATPHNGHQIIKNLENELGQVDIITQNIDGMHQRAYSKNVLLTLRAFAIDSCTANDIIILPNQSLVLRLYLDRLTSKWLPIQGCCSCENR